jgi:cbb3-type cytochrome c oxidase subunit III
MRTRQVAQAQGAKSDLVEGGFIFQENCAECHRSDGRGGGSVPRLQAYPVGADRRFIQTVLEGRNEHGMPPWGGLLTEAQIRSILEYVRALAPTLKLATGTPLEDQAREVFSQVCTTCHGLKGGGTRLAPSLQAFPGTDEEFVKVVLDGRPGTAMAPFRTMVSTEVALKIREHLRNLWRTN